MKNFSIITVTNFPSSVIRTFSVVDAYKPYSVGFPLHLEGYVAVRTRVWWTSTWKLMNSLWSTLTWCGLPANAFYQQGPLLVPIWRAEDATVAGRSLAISHSWTLCVCGRGWRKQGRSRESRKVALRQGLCGGLHLVEDGNIACASARKQAASSRGCFPSRIPLTSCSQPVGPASH